MTAIGIDPTLPCVARVSTAYAGREITSAEYNAGLRVAALEDAVKKPFYVATWADVRVGDVVLLPFLWLSTSKILKAEIVRCTVEPNLVIVVFDCGGLWGQAFDADETVYVQSRL